MSKMTNSGQDTLITTDYAQRFAISSFKMSFKKTQPKSGWVPGDVARYRLS